MNVLIYINTGSSFSALRIYGKGIGCGEFDYLTNDGYFIDLTMVDFTNNLNWASLSVIDHIRMCFGVRLCYAMLLPSASAGVVTNLVGNAFF